MKSLCFTKYGVPLFLYLLPAFLVLTNNPLSAGEAPPSPVHVAKAVVRDVPVTVEGTGHVLPGVQINIKSQINGRLEKIYVADGAVVAKGQLLYEIDKVPYTLAVKQAEANLKKAEASAAESQSLANIAAKLYKEKVIAREKLEQQQATAKEDEAMVLVRDAELDTAKQNLEYCTIKAQVPGMIGRRLQDTGNLITAYQDVLNVLNDIEKVKVVFSLPAKDFLKLSQHQRKGPLEVSIVNPQMPERILKGRMNYIGNQINAKTGMFEVQAVFDNRKMLFWPGEYVRATVTLTVRQNTVVIPYRAVFNGPRQSRMVYVVDAGNKVTPRVVKPGWRAGNEVVILEGLKDGETLVTDGIFKLYPGAKVAVVPTKEKAPEEDKSSIQK